MQTRVADSTIKGFIYQFNLTLHQLLNSNEGDTVMVEGIVEDIDIESKHDKQAIQCKYHESVEKYTFSHIYKPLAQMLVHYHLTIDEDIKYKLFAYFPSESIGDNIKITEENINDMLKSKNESIRNILKSISDKQLDIRGFLERFQFTITRKLEDLIEEVKKLLVGENLTTEDVEDLFYPNAIQVIADKSIIKDSNLRKLKKKEFLEKIRKLKKTTISRWTKELTSFEQLLKKRKAQLSINLNLNSRKRYFILKQRTINNFKKDIVNFISDYLKKYNYKIKLHTTPLFCLDCDDFLFEDIVKRLFYKCVTPWTGYIVSNVFDSKLLMKEPIKNYKDDKVEFDVRICQCNAQIPEALNQYKCDDLFVISDEKYEDIDKEDIEVEVLEVDNLEQLKFLLNLKKDIDI